MNLLKSTRCYLAGAMELAPDFGVEWRKYIGTWLRSKGVYVLDPTDKPIDIGCETPEALAERKKAKLSENYDRVREDKVIRFVDLRMTDIVDFLVVNIDIEIPTCGTWEEVFNANREKKPILVHCKQGKQRLNDWIYWTLPHQFLFGSWPELLAYLENVDQGEIGPEGIRRWYFFNWEKALNG